MIPLLYRTGNTRMPLACTSVTVACFAILVRKIALEPWQEQIVDAQPEAFIRGLIHSDGCRVRNRVNGKEYPRYHFTQVSDEIRRLFCRSLNQLGINYTWNDARNVSIARRPDVARLEEFVGPKR
jgi:LAGLIDADG-like domain